VRIASAFALLTLLAAGCVPSSDKPTLRPLYGGGTSVDAVVAGSDGLPIHYRLAGQGEPTVVLIHGWALDLNAWAAEMDRIATSHQVLAIDLAGHGQSGHERPTWTVEDLGADVAAAITTLDLRQVILVGHSLGGDVALEVNRRIPGRTVGVIGVDSLAEIGHPLPAATQRDLLDSLDGDFPKAARAMADHLLGTTAAPELRAQIETAFASAPPASALPILRAALSYDPAAALAALRAPLRLIVTTEKPDLDAIRHLHADSAVTDLTGKGLGHFPMLEGPAIFDPAFDAVLRALTPAQAERPR